MANHINKDALIAAIGGKTEMAKKDIETVIDTMTDEITKALKNGDKVTLTGFGTFRVSKRVERAGINPQTKERIQIPAMNIPKFTAGKVLKETIK